MFIWIETFLSLFTDRIITVSEQVKQEIADFGVAPIHKISVINLGFELEKFLNASEGHLKKELALSNEIKLIGIIGRLTPIKNHRLFLQAAKMVTDVLPKTRFIIVGDGELNQELKSYVRELAINDKVMFLGWRTDLPEIYADLDVVVLSSVNEGTPVALIEAMATACPVVSTNVGGVAEAVEDGENGYLVPSGDAKLLAQAIIKILEDPKKARMMGEKGRELVFRKFRIETLIKEITHLYESLLGTKPLILPSPQRGEDQR